MQVGNPHLIRQFNQDIIKNLITSNGPITKPEIARLTQLSNPTVNKIVDQLEEDGLVCRDVILEGGVGRKAQSYSINKDAAKAVVVFCVNEQFQSCITNVVGDRVEEKFTPIAHGSVMDTFRSLTDVIDGYFSRFGKNAIKVIGIGIPGVVSEDGCVSSIPMMPSWENFALKEALEKRYHIPVFIENDVKLMAVGYFYSELISAHESMVFIYAGEEGIGAGTILNQKLLRGFSSFAGELGYMSLSESDMDDEQAGPAGSLEVQLLPLSRKMAGDSPDEDTARVYYKMLARIIANFVSMINPEVIAIRSPGITAVEVAVIEKMLHNYIPGNNLPKLIAVETDQYGLRGAIYSCLSNMSSNLTLVNQIGV